LTSIFLFAFAFSNLFAGHRSRALKAPASPDASVPTMFSGTYDPHFYPCATTRQHFMVPAGQVRVVVQVSATVPTNDISVSLLYGPDPNPIFIQTEDTLTSSEVLTYTP